MNTIPVGKVVDKFVQWLLENFGTVFDGISNIIENFMGWTEIGLLTLPPLIFTIILAGIALLLANKKVALFTFGSLVFVFYIGIWINFVQTFVLVLISAILSLLIGLPIGILCSKSKVLNRIVAPILDFMQTMPPFVYLIPAAILFGIGEVPGVISTIVFSMPPSIRLTKLGLKQVPDDLIEAGDAFGLTSIQMLYKIKLPMAFPSIMAGINQTIMLSLSMVVIASMIGAEGLGSQVLTGIQQMEVGVGFEAGLGVVIMAIILDRITGSIKMGRAKNS
ncbi:ABC transporter permease [Clostridiisalibacter paucivorans]|uniref:ABC transporter permease n=1 Tax=Clostridiisalibacter paucivorans TaxID=408753 RepID=UPI000B3036EC|nr:proline/glycine betaine ABC transporter permease [Clostridiisalibacter paucivorans]